jgi:spoIIIJ-associated protein
MHTEKIKSIVEEFLKAMGLPFDSILVEESGSIKGTQTFTIKTPESGVLIGNKGMNLSALNHLIKKVVQTKVPESLEMHFSIDVNGYKEKVSEELRSKAKVMCERVKTFKLDIELEPMNPYDRMLVHSFLAEEKGVKTESRGEGMTRRVVIKYVAPVSNSVSDIELPII